MLGVSMPTDVYELVANVPGIYIVFLIFRWFLSSAIYGIILLRVFLPRTIVAINPYNFVSIMVYCKLTTVLNGKPLITALANM